MRITGKAFFISLLLLMVSFVSYGQTKKVVRQQQKPVVQKSAPAKTATAKPKSQVNVTPQKMGKGIYYLCLNWGYNLGWSQQICREMRAKGYPAFVVADDEGFILNSPAKGNSDTGYMCCVKSFTNRADAAAFYESFSDSRYNIYCARYNFHDIETYWLKYNGKELCELAEDYKYGRNGKNKSKYDVERCYLQAAYIDYDPAQLKLGLLYEETDGAWASDYKPKSAAYWYEKAAENGNAEAMARLSDFYLEGKGGRTKDYNKAMEWIKKSVAKGDPYGYSNMGYMYCYGVGVSKNYDEAIKWFRKSADLNNEWGLCQMGHVYYSGYGKDKNYVEALKWYRKAADSGSGGGMCYCGNVYYNGGYGVTKDSKEAFNWYKKSADKYHAEGMGILGAMYEHGYGTTKNYNSAKYWYERAANKGRAISMYNLGRCYEYGYGVTKDTAKAKEWYEKAAANGYEDAKSALKRLNGN